jgi:hypothetical protein
MAKSARASKVKTNNSKLKSRVFGPIETARTERLSAKLLELASQPKPTKKDSDDMVMDIEGGISIRYQNDRNDLTSLQSPKRISLKRQ